MKHKSAKEIRAAFKRISMGGTTSFVMKRRLPWYHRALKRKKHRTEHSAEVIEELIAASKEAHGAIYLHRNCGGPNKPRGHWAEKDLKKAMLRLEKALLATQPGKWLW